MLKSSFHRLLAITTVAAAAAASSLPAHAAIDTAAVTASFGDLTTALTAVGGLIIGAAALAVTFKWVKGMIFS